MHKNINQLKMGTLLSYVTIAIQNISAIIYTPLMLRFLGQNEYGLYQLGSSTVSYLGLLTSAVNVILYSPAFSGVQIKLPLNVSKSAP